MADSVEAPGQDVEEEAADELAGFEAHELLAIAAPGTSLGAIVLPAEGDSVGVGRDDPAVGDGDAVGVAAEIGKHRLGSAEGGLGVDHPFGLAQRRDEGGEFSWVGKPGTFAEEAEPAGPVGRLKPGQEQPAKQPRQHPNRQE